MVHFISNVSLKCSLTCKQNIVVGLKEIYSFIFKV